MQGSTKFANGAAAVYVLLLGIFYIAGSSMIAAAASEAPARRTDMLEVTGQIFRGLPGSTR